MHEYSHHHVNCYKLTINLVSAVNSCLSWRTLAVLVREAGICVIKRTELQYITVIVFYRMGLSIVQNLLRNLTKPPLMNLYYILL